MKSGAMISAGVKRICVRDHAPGRLWPSASYNAELVLTMSAIDSKQEEMNMHFQLPSVLRSFAQEFSKAAKEGPGVFFLPIYGAVDGSLNAIRRWNGGLKGAVALFIAPVVGAVTAIRAWVNQVR